MTNVGTLTLADFVLARIADDEARQRGHTDEDWHEFRCDIHRLHPVTKARFLCDCGAPGRLAAECAAKRKIVEQWGPFVTYNGDELLCVLAAVYADHPDYRAEWCEE